MDCKDYHNWECPTNFIHITKDENGKEIATICWKRRYLDNYLIREFDKTLLDLKLEDIDYTGDKQEHELLKTLSNSIKNNKLVGCYIYGKTGIGKTYRTICYANTMNKKNNKSIAYVYVPTFINKMKQNFDGNNQDNVLMIKKCMEADILVLDDLGSETTNKWFYTNVLLEILNSRAESNKPIIVVSNLNFKQLKEVMIKNMGLDSTETIMLERILSRLIKCCENKLFTWNGNDRRLG